jgi:hypothetical protein
MCILWAIVYYTYSAMFKRLLSLVVAWSSAAAPHDFTMPTLELAILVPSFDLWRLGYRKTLTTKLFLTFTGSAAQAEGCQRFVAEESFHTLLTYDCTYMPPLPPDPQILSSSMYFESFMIIRRYSILPVQAYQLATPSHTSTHHRARRPTDMQIRIRFPIQ